MCVSRFVSRSFVLHTCRRTLWNLHSFCSHAVSFGPCSPCRFLCSWVASLLFLRSSYPTSPLPTQAMSFKYISLGSFSLCIIQSQIMPKPVVLPPPTWVPNPVIKMTSMWFCTFCLSFSRFPFLDTVDLQGVLDRVSIAARKQQNHDQKASSGEKVYSAYTSALLSTPEGSQHRTSDRAGFWRQELRQRPCWETAY